MESADKIIGLEPFHNIQKPLVGATAEKEFFALFLNQKILLVKKIVVGKPLFGLFL